MAASKPAATNTTASFGLELGARILVVPIALLKLVHKLRVDVNPPLDLGTDVIDESGVIGDDVLRLGQQFLAGRAEAHS
jgi:hypothetical protein